jgi:hypothetical protein
MSSDSVSSCFVRSYCMYSHLPRILNKITSHKLRPPLLTLAESSIVQNPDIVQSRIDGLGFLPAAVADRMVSTYLPRPQQRKLALVCSCLRFNLRESNRKAIKQIRQPSSEFFGYIWRPRRRALDVAGVEDVDGDAPALRDDFAEEVHRVVSMYFCGWSWRRFRLYVPTKGGKYEDQR